MATLTIRNLKTEVHDALRVQAARNGRSVEAEVRHLLERAVDADKGDPVNLDEAIAEMQMYLRAANNGELPNLVDELLALRREEAAKEAAEAEAYLK